MDDEEAPRKSATHELGIPLDALSVEELNDRIGMLETEIARLREAITNKTAHRSAADAFFKN